MTSQCSAGEFRMPWVLSVVSEESPWVATWWALERKLRKAIGSSICFTVKLAVWLWVHHVAFLNLSPWNCETGIATFHLPLSWDGCGDQMT